MKKIYYLPLCLLCCFLSSNLSGQIYPSDCTVTDEVTAFFHDDAAKIALRNIYKKQSADTSSIFIPESESEPVLEALAAIYNVKDLPARNDIIELYGIHTGADPEMNAFSIYIDTAHLWAKKWMNNEMQTGFSPVDELVSNYQLDFLESPYLSTEPANGKYYLVASLISGLNLNLPAFFTEVCAVPGVVSAVHDVRRSGEIMTDISYREMEDHKEVLFSYGWGNCVETACNYYHFWQFKVYADCAVEFSGDYGDLLSTSDLQHVLKFDFFPNPVEDKLIFELVGPPQKDLDLAMYDSFGHRIYYERALNTHSGNLRQEVLLDHLGAGLYFISIINDDQVFTKRFIKK